MILWLGEMSRLFHFCPETSALGVCVLNRLLSTVKVEVAAKPVTPPQRAPVLTVPLGLCCPLSLGV